MSSARVRLPEGVDDLLLDEINVCIEQANLGRDNSLIARRYLVDQWPQIDIAAELGWGKATVSTRIPHIMQKIQKTARKLNMI